MEETETLNGETDMTCTNYAHSATELVQIYDKATSEHGYIADSISAIPAGRDSQGAKLTQVTWRWQLPALDAE